MEFNQLPNEFYPTPPELAAKMVNCKFLKGEIETILEPSAGKGDLIDFLTYGKKSYKDMNAEEKQVVDEYEGQQEYEKVYNNRENYILDVGQRMLLTDGG